MWRGKQHREVDAEDAVPAPLESGMRPGPLSGLERTDRSLPKIWDEDENTDITKTTALFQRAREAQGRPRLTAMTGIAAGQMFRLDDKRQIYVGRGRSADVRVDATGVSRVHCRIVRKGDSFFVEDLKSTNGTFVNGAAAQMTPLRAGDRLQLGPEFVLQFGFFDETEESLARRLFEGSTRDALTGTYNRRYFFEQLEAESAHARQKASRLSIVMLDLDSFKSLNDRYGQDAGDQLLRSVAAAIVESSRVTDRICRYDGEKFVVIVREPLEAAARFAERLRGRLETVRAGLAKGVTASFGVAELGERGAQLSTDGLVRLAEARLSRAKATGRNRVCAM